MTEPTANKIPDTPILRYFRAPPYLGKKGSAWRDVRLAEARRLLASPDQLATMFAESVAIVETTYHNYQPFYPDSHTFGHRANTDVAHGDALRWTVDVAARLAEHEVWSVPGYPRLSFRYIDREIEITRSKPRPSNAVGSTLVVDLFLANAHDRTPILCELKLREDECALYALIQLLTQAAYAATRSQRERLVLLGSRPEFVLLEALPDQPPMLDLYVLLVEPPTKKPYPDIQALAVELSQKLIANPHVGTRIGCIAWIKASSEGERELTLNAIAVSRSKFRRARPPKTSSG